MVHAATSPVLPKVHHIRLYSRILLVEDDPFQGFVIARHLARHDGLWVEVEHSAAEAARRITTESWDLVICDIRLGERDGAELASTPGAPPFLIISGDLSAVADVRQNRPPNVVAALEKPLNLARLMQRVVAACRVDRGVDTLNWRHM